QSTSARADFLFATNSASGEVTKYDSAGNPVSPNPFISGLSTPAGIAFDTLGNLYVANNTANTISKYDSNGNLINASFASTLVNAPIGIAIDKLNNLYVANSNNTITKYDSAGNLVNAGGTGTGPFGIALDALGSFLYVANIGDGTVSKLSTATLTGPVLVS